MDVMPTTRELSGKRLGVLRGNSSSSTIPVLKSKYMDRPVCFPPYVESARAPGAASFGLIIAAESLLLTSEGEQNG